MNTIWTTTDLMTEMTTEEIIYPERDGKPMGETDTHRKLMVAIIEALEDLYRNDPDVYVSGNLFIYYEKGNPSAVFAPDAFVVFGVPKKERRTYKLWKEGGIAPAVVFEMTSLSSWLDDEGAKMVICRRLGVREYFLYDPYGEYLDPPLKGYRLQKGQYLLIEPTPAGDLYSEVLNLYIREEGNWLRLVNAQTDELLLTPLEAQAARRAESAARREAEAEIARLKAELERLRK